MKKIIYLLILIALISSGCSKDNDIILSTPVTPGETLIASVDFDSIGAGTFDTVITKTGNLSSILAGFNSTDTLHITFLLKGQIAYDPFMPFFSILDTNLYNTYSYNSNFVSYGYMQYDSKFAVLGRTFAHYKFYGVGNGTTPPFLAIKNLKIYKRIH